MISRYEHLRTTLLVRHAAGAGPYPARFHEMVEIVLVDTGFLKITIDNCSYHLAAGDMYVLFPNLLHTITEQNCTKYLLMVSPALISGFGLLQNKPENPVVKAEHLPPVLAPMVRRCAELYGQEENRNLILLHINSILGELLPLLCLQDRGAQTGLIQKITEHILENCGGELTLEQLAQQLGYSKYHISHMISSYFHCNYRTLVNSCRIAVAEERLSHSEKPISAIMYDCGFQNQSTFNRVFLKHAGITPGDYRKLHRRTEK